MLASLNLCFDGFTSRWELPKITNTDNFEMFFWRRCWQFSEVRTDGRQPMRWLWGCWRCNFGDQTPLVWCHGWVHPAWMLFLEINNWLLLLLTPLAESSSLCITQKSQMFWRNFRSWSATSRWSTCRRLRDGFVPPAVGDRVHIDALRFDLPKEISILRVRCDPGDPMLIS